MGDYKMFMHNLGIFAINAGYNVSITFENVIFEMPYFQHILDFY